MNKKIFFTIFFPVILVISLIILFYLLFFRDINIQNKNNEDNLNLELENYIENVSEIIQTSPDFGLNIEVDGFKYCRYDEGCFKSLFLNCNIGNHIKFINENLPYSFSILSKSNDYCNILIQNLLNSDLENINCFFPLNILNKENFNKILVLNNEVLKNYCK